ncbi:carcinoembryonic antigen-related cell adhesion molecule 5 [Synchiropus splendidus]|uniref:carcinoembryonic antigen-related cell adhesion molecule 5 n=1 Tax=Synchiropus splendidus TaxID=270530 RepID=UPI00237E613F|nr:carcinoembryonic antigen-related cell adhesion molecule 5 [Synchiropus splendidus]
MDLKLLVAFLLITGSSSTQDVLPPGPVDITLGKDVVLKTLLTDLKDFAFVIWNYSDGKDQVNVATLLPTELRVDDAYKNRAWIDPKTGNLRLNATKKEDSGDYSISILQTATGTRTGEIKLRVLEPVSNVAIQSDLKEAIEHNSTVVLTCTAKGSFLKFSWVHGTAPVVADDKRISLKEEEQSSSLTIRDVLRSDAAKPFICSAANKLETEKSSPFNLTVFYGPEKVSLSPTPILPFVRAGSDFSLTCTAVSSPAATFSWIHDKKPMKAAGPVLKLQDIKAEGFDKTKGTYACIAKNAKTLRHVSSPEVSFTVMEAISGVSITGPKTTLISGNGTASLECKATAGVVLSRSWLKNGAALSAGGRLTFSKDESTLTINPVDKDDNGEYTCRLANPVNSEDAKFKLVVNYGPEPVTITGKQEVEVDDAVTLTCAAASVPPANIIWKFNDTATTVKGPNYVIEKAVYKNTGLYTCEAHNTVTGKKTVGTHHMMVKEAGTLEQGLSDGAIAGIVIAILVALAAAIALIFYCRQKVPVESPY